MSDCQLNASYSYCQVLYTRIWVSESCIDVGGGFVQQLLKATCQSFFQKYERSTNTSSVCLKTMCLRSRNLGRRLESGVACWTLYLLITQPRPGPSQAQKGPLYGQHSHVFTQCQVHASIRPCLRNENAPRRWERYFTQPPDQTTALPSFNTSRNLLSGQTSASFVLTLATLVSSQWDSPRAGLLCLETLLEKLFCCLLG